MRISDWSSDVCSSDLHQVIPFGKLAEIDPVLDEIAIARPGAEAGWQRSHHIVALGGLIGAVGAAAGGLIAVSFDQPVGWLGPAAGLLIGAGSLFGARFHRWTDLGEQVAIRRGIWKPKTTLLPHASVQSVDRKSTRLNIQSLMSTSY